VANLKDTPPSIIDYIDYITGIGTLACAMLPLPVTDTDLATGEGRKKVCPDLAITELSERSMQSVSAWRHSDPWYVVQAIYGCAELT
jgi:hypothetical protein